MAKDTGIGEVKTETENDTVEKVAHALDGWRARTDELLVQLDLAAHNIRDEVRKRLEVAQNVHLAARSQLTNARRDADSSLKSTREGFDRLIKDLQRTCDAMEAVIRRAREE